MYFSEENLAMLIKEYAEVDKKYENILVSFTDFPYKNSEAKEFATHGFTRRIKTMKRCIDNIYRICPTDMNDKPSPEVLSDLMINLQAFILNVYGSLDNLAHVWVKEKNILNKKGKPLTNTQIGFSEKYKIARNSFPDSIKDYLNTDRHKKWFSNLECFRHSLAHRIPLYVPPSVLNEEDRIKAEKMLEKQQEAMKNNQPSQLIQSIIEMYSLGKFAPWIMHSFVENSPQVVFHAQIIADWNTVEDISIRFIEEFKKP